MPSGEYPDLVKRPPVGGLYTDNFFASLNSAVFSDGSFCYIPKGVRCPMELSTYFRINSANTGQFGEERQSSNTLMDLLARG